MKTYSVKTPFGTYDDITIQVDHYSSNNSLAICLTSLSEGPFAIPTVNLEESDYFESQDLAFVDTNNYPWAEEFITENNLGVPTGEVAYSGFCVYPLYKFNLSKIESAE